MKKINDKEQAMYMRKAILNGWAGFYASDSSSIPASHTSDAAIRKAQAEYEAQIEQAAHPPSDTGEKRNPDNPNRLSLQKLFRKKQ